MPWANGNGKTDLAKDMQLTSDDLTDPKTLTGKSDDQLFDLIRKGKDKMPGEEAARAKNDEVKPSFIHPQHVKGPARRCSSRCPGNPPARHRVLFGARNELISE